MSNKYRSYLSFLTESGKTSAEYSFDQYATDDAAELNLILNEV